MSSALVTLGKLVDDGHGHLQLGQFFGSLTDAEYAALLAELGPLPDGWFDLSGVSREKMLKLPIIVAEGRYAGAAHEWRRDAAEGDGIGRPFLRTCPEPLSGVSSR